MKPTPKKVELVIRSRTHRKIQRLEGQLRAVTQERDALRGAITWVAPPFVDGKTSETELRQRIGFLVADAKRAEELVA